MKKVEWTRRCLQLKCGNPCAGEKPAAFSRFLLPFALQLTPATDTTSSSGQYYAEVSISGNYDGRTYFTYETSEMLYDRAVWAKLQNWTPVSFPVYSPETPGLLPVCVSIAPPRIILFESRTDRKTALPGDPLQSGILVVEAYFEDPTDESERQPDLDDLLLFNEFFRFFKLPFKEHGTDFKKLFAAMPIDFFQNGSQTVGNYKGPIEDCYFNRWHDLLKQPLELKNGDRFYLHPDLRQQQGAAGQSYLVYDDNRTFVCSCAMLTGGLKALGQAFHIPTNKPEQFGHWIKLLNVDKPGSSPLQTHFSSDFEQEWARQRTYTRWLHGGTLYGFNYHSGVLLSPTPKEKDPPVWRHFSEMYFDQILLLFYIRITLFRFSRELTEITKCSRDTPDPNRDLDNFESLHRKFAEFTNLYQYPLISNQQQGIEMYSLAREYLDLDSFYKEIRSEITSTHELMEIQAANRLNTEAHTLTSIGLPVAFIAVIVTVLGMDTKLAESVWNCLTGGGCSPRFDFMGPVILFSALSWLTCCIVVFLVRRKRNLCQKIKKMRK